MRRKSLVSFLMMCGVIAVSLGTARAQWTPVLRLQGTYPSSAFFFNATEGMIGTGTYRPMSATTAGIYLTNDGGTTWHMARLPNPDVIGQITDIYFRDRLHGWATLSEGNSKGWGGVYHSTDGGETWNFVRPAGNAAGVRETSRGVFYTDRAAGGGAGGVVFSGDQGKTWTVVATTDYPLGIDFMDDATGFVTTQGNSLGLHLLTTDGGRTWNPIPASWRPGENATEEAWSVFGDPIGRKFFIASEHWPLGTNLLTSIFSTPVKNPLETSIKAYSDSGITGGIAGSHTCRSVIYVQGWSSLSNGPRGFVRSMDGGASWVAVGGPMNSNDTRFAVTGRGATVFAGDASGVVWRTNTGGDGTLSLSALASIALTPQNSNAANGCYAVPVCDSAIVPILLEYRACDSSQMARVESLNDTAQELSAPQALNQPRFFSTHQLDTLRLVYRPTRQENWTARLKITFRQPDGYLEDTTIGILLNGTAPNVDPLAFSETTAKDSIDFGSVSLCADADHKVTLINTGCSDLTIQTMDVTGAQFLLTSSFRPFVLSPGTSRTFLVHYTPSSGTREHGSLFIRHSSGTDAVVLSGTGFAPNKTLSLQFDSVFSSLCDSVAFTVKLRNVACTPFKILTVTTDTPLRFGALPSIDSLRQGETTNLPFTFTPSNQKTVLDTVHIRVAYAGSTGPYDTTIVIAATGTTGKPDIALVHPDGTQATSLNLGSISICSQAEDTLLVQGTGCGDVTVSGQFDQQNGFSFVRAPAATVRNGTVDTVIVRYHPGTATGPQTANLILTTSAGTKTIVCRVAVTQDPGAVTLSTSVPIQTYTCLSTNFIFSISNTTCDSLDVTKIVIGGAAQQDFSLNEVLPIHMISGAYVGIHGLFSPQDSLVRNASVTVTIQRADGSTYDTTIQISGIGIGVPPIKVAVRNGSYTAKPFASVYLPIYAVTSSILTLDTFDFAIHLNTDLLTPIRIVPGKGSFGSANVQKFNVTQDSLDIRLALPNDIDLTAGEICEIECTPYVASKLYTPITLGHVRFDNASGTTQCFTAQALPDSVASFALDRECGDTTLAEFLGSGSITLNRITPNPTHGEVRLDFHVPPGYQSDAVLEVYDVMGSKLSTIPLEFDGVADQQSFDLDLHGAGSVASGTDEGIRYLRIRSLSGSAVVSPLVTKVILWK